VSDPIPGKTIVLVGLPRSGTTWLAKIFDSHPDTFYSHEPDSALPFPGLPLLVPADSANRYRAGIESHLRAMSRVRVLRVAGKLPLFPKSYATQLPLWLRTQSLVVLKAASRAFGEISVPASLAGTPDRAPYWVWKSIESAGRLGVLARILPGARIVYIVRHPCGVAASLLRGEQTTKFSDGPASEDFGFFKLLAETEQARSRGLTLERFQAMSPVERVAWRWAILNDKALDDLEGVPNCKLVRYEELCERPVEVSRDLFDFSGLSWNAQTERFIERSTSGEDASSYAVFKNPLLSAYKWREQLAPEIIESILRITAQTRSGKLYAGADSLESAPRPA
jgi:hypothetical protein